MTARFGLQELIGLAPLPESDALDACGPPVFADDWPQADNQGEGDQPPAYDVERVATAGANAMLTDVARLTAMQDYALDGVDYLRPGRIRSLFSGQVQAGGLAVFAQDWLCRVQARLRAPCERPLGTDAGGYLPPDGQPLPGKAHAGDDPWLPPLEGLALRYWCKPPQDPATDPPLLEDHLTLNIRI